VEAANCWGRKKTKKSRGGKKNVAGLSETKHNSREVVTRRHDVLGAYSRSIFRNEILNDLGGKWSKTDANKGGNFETAKKLQPKNPSIWGRATSILRGQFR